MTQSQRDTAHDWRETRGTRLPLPRIRTRSLPVRIAVRRRRPSPPGEGVPCARAPGGKRDRVVSKDELIQSVWNGAAVSDDVVFRCVIDLRAALGDDRKSPRFIRTVPKVGYRFICPLDQPDPMSPPAPPPVRKRSSWILYAALGVVAAGTGSTSLYGRRRPPWMRWAGGNSMSGAVRGDRFVPVARSRPHRGTGGPDERYPRRRVAVRRWTGNRGRRQLPPAPPWQRPAVHHCLGEDFDHRRRQHEYLPIRRPGLAGHPLFPPLADRYGPCRLWLRDH